MLKRPDVTIRIAKFAPAGYVPAPERVYCVTTHTTVRDSLWNNAMAATIAYSAAFHHFLRTNNKL